MSFGGINAGKASIILDIRNRTARGLTAAERRLQAFGASVSTIGRNLAAVGGAGLVGLFAGPIQSASDLQESFSKFETVFGDQSKAVKEWADNFAKEVGRSEAQVVDFLGRAQDTFVPLGFDPAEAEALSKTLAGLSIDLASFNNLGDEDAFNSLLSALVGNTENLRKFGVVAQDAQIKAEALTMGLDPNNLTAFEKAQAILNLTLKGTTAAQGDAIRTADSYANQVKRLQGEFRNLSDAIGGPLIGVVTPIVETIGQVVGYIRDWAKENEDLSKTVLGLVAGATALGVALVAIGASAMLIGTAFGGLASILGVITAPMAAISSLLVTWPGILLAVGAALVAMNVNWASLAEAATGPIEYVMGLLGELRTTWDTTVGGMADALKAGEIQLAAEILWAGLTVLFEQGVLEIREKVSPLKTFFEELWASVVNSTAIQMTQLGSFVNQAFQTVFYGLQSSWDALVATITVTVNKLAGLNLSDVTDPGAFIRELSSDIAEARGDAIGKNSNALAEKLTEIREGEKEAVKLLESDLGTAFEKIRDGENDSLDGYRNKLEQSKARLGELREQAREAAEISDLEKEVAAIDVNKDSNADKLDQLKKTAASNAKSSGVSASGTFSSLAARQFDAFPADQMREQVGQQKKTIAAIKEVNDTLKSPNQLRFG